MLFGLSNTPASFYGYINKILIEKLDIFVIVYLENILVYTKDLGKPHVKVVQRVLEWLQKYCLFANLKKYWFYQAKVWFLGFVVLVKGVSIEEEWIETVKTCSESQSVQDI